MGRVPDHVDDADALLDTGPSPPLGIKIYCVLAGLLTVYRLFRSFVLVGVEGPGSTAAAIAFVLFLAFLVVLHGLWTLESWAWTWAVGLFGLYAIVALLGADVIGLGFSLLVLGYLVSKAGYYRGDEARSREQTEDRQQPRA